MQPGWRLSRSDVAGLATRSLTRTFRAATLAATVSESYLLVSWRPLIVWGGGNRPYFSRVLTFNPSKPVMPRIGKALALA